MKTMRLFFLFLLAAAAALAGNEPAPASDPQVNQPPMPSLKGAEKEGPQYPRIGTKEYWNLVIRTPEMPRIELQAPMRLADFVVDGKIELSLKSYTELVMLNNTDIQIQKLLIETPKNAIARAFSVFDPLLTANFNAQRSITPTTDVLQGATTLSNLQQPLNLQWQQTLSSGTVLTGAYRFLKTSNNNAFASFNPAFNSNADLRFSQPLLRGRGASFTRLPILLAKARQTGALYNLEDQVLRLLVQAENAYWDVIGARENLRVQEQALALADASLKRAQRELELGALSALEIYQPQATYARAEIFVTQARYRLQQVEDTLRRQISVDLDPDLRKLPIVLTESVLPPTNTQPFDRESIVSDALRARPDLKVFQNNLSVDDYNIKLTANALKPDVSLTGVYTMQGRGGPQTRRSVVIGPGGTTGTLLQVIPGGFGDAWSQMWGFGFPVYGGGLTMRLPIKDRRAVADYADATVQKRLDSLRVRQTEQQIRTEVLNAISQVENSRASVDLAKIAADLAQKRVEADQKRYDLGTITLFFLLDSQNSLTQAQSELVNNSVQYRRNLLNLLQRSGSLLQERGITLR